MVEPPGMPPKELERSKLVWRALLIANLAIAAYMFTRPRKKDSGAENHKKSSNREVKERKAEEEAPVSSINMFSESVFGDIPVKIREPILEDQQREIFKWILEEKREVKPFDRTEKKRIDEDEACLKRFIGADSIPDF